MNSEWTTRTASWRGWPLAAAAVPAVTAVLFWLASADRERQHIGQLAAAEASSVNEQIASSVGTQRLALVRMAQRLESWSEESLPRQIDLEKHWSRDARLHVQHRQGYQAVALMNPESEVQAVVPAVGNEALLGDALARQPRVARVLDDARRTRDSQVSQTIDLPTGQTGFVVAVPVYFQGEAAELVKGEFAGFVTGVFDLKQLLDSVLHDGVSSGFHVALFDASGKVPREIYRGRGAASAIGSPAKSAVELNGVPWAIRVWPTAQLLSRERTIWPEVTLVAGLLVAFLLGAAIYEFQKERAWAERQEQTREQLERAERSHRLTLENCLDAFVAIDQAGIVQEWNQQAEHIFGWPREEVLGRPVREVIVPEEQRDAHQRGLQHFVETGEGPLLNRRIEVESLRKDGSRFPLELTITPLETADGLLFTAFARDVTERKRAESQLRALNETLEQRVADRTSELQTTLDQLKRAKETAEEANQAKSVFLANMSHEIRTPLNGVIGMTELLRDTRLTTVQREYVELVHDSGESLLMVINDILDFSKIEAGRLEFEHVPFDHAESLGDAMKSLGLRAHGKGLELTCGIAPDVPRILTGDPARLRQVLVNLVGNAVKFTDEGEVVVEVELAARRTNGQPAEHSVAELHYTVRDTGVGIAPEKFETIFEAFEQADGTKTRRVGGTGLGLAISARLVEMMGGRIWVESQPGRGSMFHFTACFEAPREQPPLPQPADAAALHNLPVLIVDDNATNRRILADTLASWGLVPTTAADADQALAALREPHRRFRLVITDVHMPRRDGFELVEQIKQEPQLVEDTVILMLSSGDRPGDIIRCDTLGIDCYLIKPIKQSELYDALLMALGMMPSDETREGQRAADDVAGHQKPLKILLAEDSPVNQKLAIAMLANHGHQVDVAQTGHEAVNRYRQDRYDVVLMDVQMPEMDGLEATRLIRSHEQQTGRFTPIIAMTALAMKGDRERCLDAGMDDYVAKPVRSRELFKAIGRLLGSDESAARNAPAASHDDQPSKDGNGSGAKPAPLVDWQVALQTAMGKETMLRDLADGFLKEAGALINQMTEAMEDEDADTLCRVAHTIKGNCRIFGAAVPEHLAFHIENSARDGRVDVAEAAQKLTQQLQHIQGELRDWLSGRVTDTPGMPMTSPTLS